VLPLTTDYWPAQAELRLNYSEYNHTLVLVQNQNDYNNGGLSAKGGREGRTGGGETHAARLEGRRRGKRGKRKTSGSLSLSARAPRRCPLIAPDMSALLEEMICQRQAQDYQHIVSDLVPPAKPGTSVYYFSLRNQVHAITWDKRSNTIDVRRHIHKRVIQDRKLVKFPYSYFLYSAHTGSFVNVQRDMEPNRDDPPWSYADNVLCDAHFYADDLSEGLKYRRIQSVAARQAKMSSGGATAVGMRGRVRWARPKSHWCPFLFLLCSSPLPLCLGVVSLGVLLSLRL